MIPKLIIKMITTMMKVVKDLAKFSNLEISRFSQIMLEGLSAVSTAVSL